MTAGATREPIDDVRFLSNASTGRMGWEIAREARRRGARVTLLLGPCDLPPLPGVTTVPVETTRDLLTAAKRLVSGCDLAVFAAAPADWRPAKRVRGKIKKGARGKGLVLRLVQNPDVAATLGRSKGNRVHIGFALESAHPFEYAIRKLVEKNFDAVVLNGPANVGRGGGAAWWIDTRDRPERLPTRDKRLLARAIVDRAFALLHGGARTVRFRV